MEGSVVGFCVKVDGEILPRASRSSGFKAVGVQLSFDNSYQIEIEGDLVDNIFSYNVIVTLNQDVDPEGQHLDLFVSEDSVSAWWSACVGTGDVRRSARHFA